MHVRALSLLVLAIGCGARTGMLTDGAPFSVGGGGASSSAGSASAGAPAFAGQGGAALGGASSGGSAGAQAGAPSSGASNGGTSGGPSCVDPRLVSVSPKPASVGVASNDVLHAFLSCPLDPSVPWQGTLRATGRYAGILPGTLAQMSATDVFLEPRAPDNFRKSPFFPGELVTGWVAPALGGPFQWQFTAATRPKGSPHFTQTPQALNPAQDAELGDLDRDGDLDLVTGSSFDNVGRVWLNDGKGFFTLGVPLPPITESLLADVDADGDLDIISTHLYLNDGSAHFTEAQEMGAVQAVFDADGDGDMDVFSQRPNDEASLLFNDGKGVFSVRSVLFGGDLFDAKAGDLDNDGDLDLVAIIYDTSKPRVARMILLLNDGRGVFKETATDLKYDATRTLALGDVDQDGDLDVFLASWGAAGARNPDDQVWLNDGHAHFTLGDSPISGSIDVTLQDLDGDNDLDAIVGQHPPYSVVAGEPSRILLNDGKGHFMPGSSLGGSNFQHLTVGDLDGDGDLDAIVAQWDWTLHPPVQVWLQDN